MGQCKGKGLQEAKAAEKRQRIKEAEAEKIRRAQEAEDSDVDDIGDDFGSPLTSGQDHPLRDIWHE